MSNILHATTEWGIICDETRRDGLEGSTQMPEDTSAQLRVRLSPHLRAALDRAAERAETSLNKEIVSRLERSFDRWASVSPDDLVAQITKVLGWLADHQRTMLERDLREPAVRDTAIREVTFCISALIAVLRALGQQQASEGPVEVGLAIETNTAGKLR
jgi:hypothetical protein